MADRPKGSIAAWWADSYKLPRDRFLGSAEVALKLSVTRQRVSQLRRDPTFPRPRMQGWGAFVWDAAGIECWASVHRPDRPSAAGRFTGEPAAVLVEAEHHAQRLGIHWINTAFFWLAIVAGASGESLRATLASMGITGNEIEAWMAGSSLSDIRPHRSYRMTPHLQTFLAAADRAAAAEGRGRVRALDILLAFIDAERRRDHHWVLRPTDNQLSLFERRGLDIAELRRRLVAADADPAAIATFEPRRLKSWRPRKRKKPAWLDLAPNPLGHDPWVRHPWGAGFAVTRDGRHLKVDGEVWFFTIDGDGFYVLSADGRPVGYRYRVEPKPRLRPVNGFMEILPMPPVEMADWPDRRFVNDD
jgi:predicted DNA-binding transcriptional regulator AlpA